MHKVEVVVVVIVIVVVQVVGDGGHNAKNGRLMQYTETLFLLMNAVSTLCTVKQNSFSYINSFSSILGGFKINN